MQAKSNGRHLEPDASKEVEEYKERERKKERERERERERVMEEAGEAYTMPKVAPPGTALGWRPCQQRTVFFARWPAPPTCGDGR